MLLNADWSATMQPFCLVVGSQFLSCVGISIDLPPLPIQFAWYPRSLTTNNEKYATHPNDSFSQPQALAKHICLALQKDLIVLCFSTNKSSNESRKPYINHHASWLRIFDSSRCRPKKDVTQPPTNEPYTCSMKTSTATRLKTFIPRIGINAPRNSSRVQNNIQQLCDHGNRSKTWTLVHSFLPIQLQHSHCGSCCKLFMHWMK